MLKVLKKEKTNKNNQLQLFGADCSINDAVLVIGVVHGDEPQGEELIKKYMNEFPESKLMFVPCLNPDGRDLGTRVNSNGVDINRNFPTNNWELSEKDNYYGGKSPASEIETKFLVDILKKYNIKSILTLHTPYKVVNYDGPAQKLAEDISKIINYPVEESIGYPTPGSFGTYVGVERNIPIITLEMDEEEKFESLYPKIKKIFEYLEKY